MSPTARDALDLADWRRRVAELYARVRGDADPAHAWTVWRAGRDDLFREHPQSPARGTGPLAYFDYDPSFRVVSEVDDAPRERVEIDGIAFERVGVARFELHGVPLALDVHWLDAYPGGLFVPVRDATSGRETYGGGRYVVDSSKGADLGSDAGRLVLDFNFAYNPSCAYDPRWACPLAPAGNRATQPIRAGELVFRPRPQ